ncbi:MAG: HEPN domain-containing protein [Chloroflexota bacterium]|nr:HEPN domain-containing protein [Chloroflexota bacterium]
MVRSKPKAYQAFKDNIADAEALLGYAVAFNNQRSRRMRKELRDRIGDALGIPQKHRDQLDCLQSRDVFMVFPPAGALSRDHFRDLRPLLRQSLVAACAALESYVADKAMEFVGQAIRAPSPPPRMRSIPLTVGRWIEIERSYERTGWAIRDVVGEYVQETSSTAPNRIGEVLSAVGVKNWIKRVDQARGLKPGTTERELKAITERRNRIAHTADRHGRGRAPLDVDEVVAHLYTINSIVDTTEDLLKDHKL